VRTAVEGYDVETAWHEAPGCTETGAAVIGDAMEIHDGGTPMTGGRKPPTRERDAVALERDILGLRFALVRRQTAS
jgi:hypothetical protein